MHRRWLLGAGVLLPAHAAMAQIAINRIGDWPQPPAGPANQGVTTLNLTGPALPGLVTLTRASTGTYFDAAGTLRSAAADAPRFDFDPTTHAARGIYDETAAATNGIRNNSMTGAVAADGLERAVNGTFATDPFAGGGWTKTTAGTATAVWNGAGAGVTLRGDGTNSAIIDQQIATVAGLTYTISTTVSGATSTLSVGASQGGTNLVNGATQAIGTTTLQVTASGATMWLRYLKTVAASSTISSASVQSAGRLPDNWLIANTSGALLSYGLGTESGLPYLQVNVFGTAAGGVLNLNPEGTQIIAAANGQTWTKAAYLSAVSGAQPGNLSFGFTEKTAAGGTAGTHSKNITPTTDPLSAQRWVQTSLNTQATAAFVQPFISFTMPTAAVNYSFRLALPKLAQEAAASSDILTTNAAATRAAEAITAAVPAGAYDVLTQDTAGGAWTTATVAAGATLPIAPRTGQTHITRVRLARQGVLSAGQKAAMATAYP